MDIKFIRRLYRDYLKLEMEIWCDKGEYYHTTVNSMFSPWKISEDNSWLKIMKPYINNYKETK